MTQIVRQGILELQRARKDFELELLVRIEKFEKLNGVSISKVQIIKTISKSNPSEPLKIPNVSKKVEIKIKI